MMGHASLKNKFLRNLCRAYPVRKGRYRLMMLCESLLDRKTEITSDLCGRYHLALNLAERGLQSSFYYFIPEHYETETQKYILEFVKPGMTTVDVGAHIGLFTILMAHRTGPGGKVYSFEPESKNFSSLKKNIELNHLSWVRPFQQAISNKTGEDILIISTSDSTHALGHALDHSDGMKTEKIKTITLDDFVRIEKIQKIDLIKIDAEQSEHLVLEGARESLKRGIFSQIICEIHSSHKTYAAGGDSVRKVFYAHGYRSFVLNPKLAKKEFLAELHPGEAVHGLQNLLFKK